MKTTDKHLSAVTDAEPSSMIGCTDCLAMGGQRWVHLNMCRVCGHVGCCDNSPNQHATAHFHATKHPIIQRFEPGEDWGYCYVDEALLKPFPPELATAKRHIGFAEGYRLSSAAKSGQHSVVAARNEAQRQVMRGR